MECEIAGSFDHGASLAVLPAVVQTLDVGDHSVLSQRQHENDSDVAKEAL